MEPSGQTQAAPSEVRLDLWGLWVVVNAAAWAVGLGGALASGIAVTERLRLGQATGEYSGLLGLVGVVAALFAGTAMTAIAVAVGQWLVLRRHISRAGWWILASILGMIAGIGAAVTVGKTLPSWAGLGTIVAIPQWFVLHSKVPRAGWWIPVGLLAGAVGGAVGQVMAGMIWMMPVVSTSGLLAAALFVPGVVASTVTGAVLVWLMRKPAPPRPPTGPERARPSTIRAPHAPGSDDYVRAEKRRELARNLPLTVPVEPRGLVVVALSMGIGLAWVMLGVLILWVAVFLRQFSSLSGNGQDLTLIVLLAFAGMVGAIAISLTALNSPLNWLARSGTLTIDQDGIRLLVGAREEAFTWRQPIRTRSWKASFMDVDADVYEDMYEVWQLDQGSAQMTISRRGKITRRRLLSQYAASGQRLPTTQRGLLVPLKANLVFDAIASMGNLQCVENGDRD